LFLEFNFLEFFFTALFTEYPLLLLLRPVCCTYYTRFLTVPRPSRAEPLLRWSYVIGVQLYLTSACSLHDRLQFDPLSAYLPHYCSSEASGLPQFPTDTASAQNPYCLTDRTVSTRAIFSPTPISRTAFKRSLLLRVSLPVHLAVTSA
jgi:hypothetical protein